MGGIAGTADRSGCHINLHLLADEQIGRAGKAQSGRNGETAGIDRESSGVRNSNGRHAPKWQIAVARRAPMQNKRHYCAAVRGVEANDVSLHNLLRRCLYIRDLCGKQGSVGLHARHLHRNHLPGSKTGESAGCANAGRETVVSGAAVYVNGEGSPEESLQSELVLAAVDTLHRPREEAELRRTKRRKWW